MADAQKLKVFISYSRKDSTAFADELVAGLELASFAPFLDRHDIAAGEDWETRLGSLISEADTVVYVISPEAVKSERCGWEVTKTLTLSKRLIPIVYKPVSEADIPERLSRLQFIRFDVGFGITRPLTELADALRQDIDWIREHTRIADLAARWQARARPSSILLRGEDLVAARAWAAKRNQEAPEITESQTAFLNASIAESRVVRQRQLLVLTAFGTLAAVIVVAFIGWINRSYLGERWHWFTAIRPYMQTQILPYVLSSEAERSLKPGDTFRECAKDCPEMVVVPAGRFIMGSPTNENGRDDDEGPQHEVNIQKAFAVSKLAVTNGYLNACVSVGNCPEHRDGRYWEAVTNVNWSDAKRYAAWLSQMTGKRYRLLSEAEYEYAARAGTQTVYPWGDEIGKGNANCNGCGSRWDRNALMAPAGSFGPNQFGLYDMLGTVFEWVEDCYHEDYNSAPTDGAAWITTVTKSFEQDTGFRYSSGDCSRRRARGGSYMTKPASVRSGSRAWFTVVQEYDNLGFRLARTLTP
jgi:formylglycine-generating enzyme required for sulfatase activity